MEHFITLQEMFLVSYSILFGIMLNSCMGLGLFFFGWISCANKKPLIRILASFFFINLFVFGIYRVFHLIIYRFRNCLYGDEILNYPAVNRRLDAIGPSAKGHFVAILVYIIIAFIGAFWVKECQALHDLYGWFILLDTWTCMVILIGFIGALFLLTRACVGSKRVGKCATAKCGTCTHRTICGLRIRLARVQAHLVGHTLEGLHDWLDSFAVICKHYQSSRS